MQGGAEAAFRARVGDRSCGVQKPALGGGEGLACLRSDVGHSLAPLGTRSAEGEPIGRVEGGSSPTVGDGVRGGRPEEVNAVADALKKKGPVVDPRAPKIHTVGEWLAAQCTEELKEADLAVTYSKEADGEGGGG